MMCLRQNCAQWMPSPGGVFYSSSSIRPWPSFRHAHLLRAAQLLRGCGVSVIVTAWSFHDNMAVQSARATFVTFWKVWSQTQLTILPVALYKSS
eukprot:270296-Amphidinium_carterae.1